MKALYLGQIMEDLKKGKDFLGFLDYMKKKGKNNPMTIKCFDAGIFRIHVLVFLMVNHILQPGTADCIPCVKIEVFLKAGRKAHFS